jgi:hypothetical protein
MVAYGLAGLAVAIVLTAFGLAIGIPLLGGRPGPTLGAGEYLRAAGGGLLACWLAAMFGVAVGVLIAHQVPAVVGTLVFLLIAEPLIGAASHTVAKFLPGSLLAAAGGDNGGHELAWGAALAALAAWTIAGLAVAAWVDGRRDIT